MNYSFEIVSTDEQIETDDLHVSDYYESDAIDSPFHDVYETDAIKAICLDTDEHILYRAHVARDGEWYFVKQTTQFKPER